MIDFDLKITLTSILFAVIFGVLYAVLYSVVYLLKSTFGCIPSIIRDIVSFDKILPLPRFEYLSTEGRLGGFLTSLLIILFGLGFSILSYISLDGQIRIYMLFFSFASFYLSKKVFFNIFIRFFFLLLSCFLILFSIILRVIILPIKMIIHYFLRKVKKQSV